MKFVFINDNSEWLASLKMALGNSYDIEFVECHSVDDGLNAMRKHRPQVVFLDHKLTPAGNEGLEIVDQKRDPHSGIPSVVFYSTTTLETVVPEYEKRRIPNITPLDLQKLKRIMSDHVFAEQARQLIDQVGPSIGKSIGNFTDEPDLLQSRPGICAVRRQTENGYSDGFDTIYLVWRTKDGGIQHRWLARSMNHEYMQIRGISEEGKQIVVEVSDGEKIRIALSDLGLE